MAAAVYTGYSRFATITKSDTVNFDGSTYSATPSVNPKPADAVYVGTAGVVVVIAEDGTAVSFTAVAGAILPVRCIRINSTNTVPTLMVALYS